MKFIVDQNVGKLAKWLRVMGYDTLFHSALDDGEMLRIAMKESRVVLTKDTQILKRRIVTTGRVKVLFIEHDDFEKQLQQVMKTLNLERHLRSFSLCIECNQGLVPREKEEVQELVPPYVFQTQTQYMECPSCHRIYWRGTHWQRMKRRLEEITEAE